MAEKNESLVDRILGQKKDKKIQGQKNTYQIRQGIVKEIIVHSPLEEKIFEVTPFVKKENTEVVLEADPREEKLPPMVFRKKTKPESKLSLLIIPSEEYHKNIYFLSKYLAEKYGMVLYVSLNELYSNLTTNFRIQKIDTGKFYFVDAITSSAETNPQKSDNCTFVVSPNSLVELSLAISSAIERKNPSTLLFDSISTMLVYENPKTVVKFIHSLIGKIKAAGIDAYFTCLEGDSQGQAIKDLGMFVDDFISIDKFRMYKVELSALPKEENEEGMFDSSSKNLFESLEEFGKEKEEKVVKEQLSKKTVGKKTKKAAGKK